MKVDANTKLIIPFGFLITCSGWLFGIASHLGWIGEAAAVAIPCEEVRLCMDCNDIDQCVDGDKLVKLEEYQRDKDRWVPRTELNLIREFQTQQYTSIMEELSEIRKLLRRQGQTWGSQTSH